MGVTPEPTLRVVHVPDADVDAELDAALRALFSTCFTGPADVCFQTRRYVHELPAQRWLIRDAGRVVAHAAVHDKTIGTPSGDLRIGGVAEVCVAPDFRGRGLVSAMLDPAEEWMRREGIPFSLLMGRAGVYTSRGYLPIGNPLRTLDPATGMWKTGPVSSAQIKPLATLPWPEGEINLRSPLF